MEDADLSRLKDIYAEMSHIDQAMNLLSWDQETYMPPGAVLDRAGQMSTLSAVLHRKGTDPEIGALLNNLEGGTRSENDSAIIREIARGYKRRTSLPERLVKEIAETSSIAQDAWSKARKKDDFSLFRPYLRKMVELKIEEAEHVGYEDRIYDALLDDYEPYMRSREVTGLFSSLKDELVPIVRRIAESGYAPDESVLTRRYPRDAQERFSIYLSRILGYDMERGRLDVSAHPFTSGTRRDVRITTRYYEDDIRSSVFSTIHETGHALYEQGFAEEHYLTPLAESLSLGIHESQSRFWENIVGRSRPFWSHLLPALKEHFPNMGDVSLDVFYRAINSVRPSLIRTESDEVTYNLHVLIRYEMETGIIEGKVGVDEIPGLWNEKYEKYLGITPPTDSDGCLQDIHWSMGLFGYFPTYTLGNLYSAQIYDRMRMDIPEFFDLVSSGDLGPLLAWLREKIHRRGKLYPPKMLIEKATGSAPSEDHFISYLKEKFSGIYGISL